MKEKIMASVLTRWHYRAASVQAHMIMFFIKVILKKEKSWNQMFLDIPKYYVRLCLLLDMYELYFRRLTACEVRGDNWCQHLFYLLMLVHNWARCKSAELLPMVGATGSRRPISVQWSTLVIARFPKKAVLWRQTHFPFIFSLSNVKRMMQELWWVLYTETPSVLYV